MIKWILKELRQEVEGWFRTIWPTHDSRWELKEDVNQVGYWLERKDKK